MIPKEIMKLYEKLAFSRGYEEAFRDFLDVCLYYLSVGMLAEDYRRAVSYTHLTLPTICSV